MEHELRSQEKDRDEGNNAFSSKRSKVIHLETMLPNGSVPFVQWMVSLDQRSPLRSRRGKQRSHFVRGSQQATKSAHCRKKYMTNLTKGCFHSWAHTLRVEVQSELLCDGHHPCNNLFYC